MFFKFLFLIFFLLFTLNCSRKTNTFITRSYHNLTAYYNAYFNGKEAFKEGIKKIYNQPYDDYLSILNVYPFNNKNATKQVFSDMEKVKEKAAIVIKKHSITVPPKIKDKSKLTPKKKQFYQRSEFCEWVPKAWLLNGKANYIQNDWYSAEENFEYVIKEYTWDPAKYEASIWLALTYMQLSKFEDAISLLNKNEGDKNFDKKLLKDLYLTYSEIFIKEKKYSQAITNLTKGIYYTKKRTEKARLYYILAQLYQQINDYSNAQKYYDLCIKHSNNYDLTFYAIINKANCYDISSSGSEQLKKQLQKMIKDEKNKDYLDQIYYSLGNIYLKENDINKANYYFDLCLKHLKNESLKGVIYYTLGDLNFKKKNYILAKDYYDSSLIFLPKENLAYERIKKLSEDLTDLAKNLKIIYTEDSLQRIAKLPESERNKIINEIIKKIIEEEQKKLKQQQEEFYNKQFMQNNPFFQSFSQKSEGKWYFYNPSTLSLGAMEFKRKWGNRPLEDDWRRKNKNTIAVSFQDENKLENANTVNKNDLLSPKQFEYYYKNLPLNDSLLNLSNKRLEEALFNAGIAAMTKVKDYDLSLNLFNDFINRFPNSPIIVEVYYKLYLLAITLQNEELKNNYKKIIIDKFPNSKYAKIINNPNYQVNLLTKRNELISEYEKVLILYKKNLYLEALELSNELEKKLDDDNKDLYIKLLLLKAIINGSLYKLNEYEEQLKFIINNFSNTNEAEIAKLLLLNYNNADKNYLTSLNIMSPKLPDQQNQYQIHAQNNENLIKLTEQKNKTYNTIFKEDEKDEYFIIILIDKSANLNLVKFNLYEFNTDLFSYFDFSIFNGIFSEKYNYLKVHPFSSKDQARKYYKHLVKNKEKIFENINEKLYYILVISNNNLTRLTNNKNIDEYLTYMQDKILNN